MGAFLLLSGDYRIGAGGTYKLSANEVAIGLTMPLPAVEILRNRLTPSCFNRAVLLAETFSPQNAVEAGFLDRVVDGADVASVAHAAAEAACGLDPVAHAASKLRARRATLEAIRAGIDADFGSTVSA
jgi:enoyl-CoA hydratase